jgi:methionyl-tRNA synthetase
VAVVDGYITEKAPWKLKAAEDAPRRASILYNCAEALRIITALAYPVLPDATAKIWAQLGLGDISQADLKNVSWGQLTPGTALGPLGPIFPRAEKDTVNRMHEIENGNEGKGVGTEPTSESTVVTSAPSAPATAPGPTAADEHASIATEVTAEIAGKAPSAVSTAAALGTSTPAPEPAPRAATITIDDFAKVELRVAQVRVAEPVKGADRLLRLEVDLGNEVRQIVAGIAGAYKPEELIGRKVVIVANLQPRKLRGLESNGMIVAASVGEKGKPVLAGFLEDVEIGARLK